MVTMHVLSGSASFAGCTTKQRARSELKACSRASVVVHAQQEEQAIARRSALGLAAGAAILLGNVAPSQAAFGDAANVFGKATNTTGFVPYSGEGFALLLPSKWNLSRERDFPGVVLRYEDNGDAVNNVVVITRPTDKNSIEDFGAPDKFLEAVSYLFGQQVFTGETRSEGGFKANSVSSASLLDVQKATDKKGKPYYKYELLTRSADGDEGGRHQLITAAVNNGQIYILKVQIGDKRWFKGAKTAGEGIANSFVVA